MATGRVVFFDFDGVLHPFGGGPEQFFRRMELVYPLLEASPEIRVVVHSSWREIHDDDELKNFLFYARPELADRFIGSTPREIMSRWESIEEWAKQNPEAGPFCILDDEPRLFPSHIAQGQSERFYFIGCDSKVGLHRDSPALLKLTAWLSS